MSVRAELVRLGLRLWIKRQRFTTAEAARRQMAAIGWLVPWPPKGTHVARLELGGVKAIGVAPGGWLGNRRILYLHGGGHVSGSPVLYRDFTWRIATAAEARVFILDHRLAPEHPFPAALEDAAAAYRALLADGADPRRMAVMGESAGGGLVLSLLLKLRDERVPLPAVAVAISPWTDLALTGGSWRLNAKADPMLRSDDAPRFASCYLDGADPRSPYASPLYGDPTGLPPTLIQVGSDEVLLDDSVRMADRMRAAGCRVELEVWPRMPHAWHLWARIMPEAHTAIAHAGAFVAANSE